MKYVITIIVATPASVAIDMFTFNAAVKTTVIIIGKKDITSRLRLALEGALVRGFLLSGLSC